MHLSRGLLIALIILVISECQPFQALNPQQGTTAVPPGTRSTPAVAPLDLKELPDTIRVEYQDRINRFNRLASAQGVAPPSIDELQVAAGQIPGVSFPVPVIRLIFSEKVFFDFDHAEVKPEAMPLLALVAENMRRDLPDTQILILGHTDAIGSDKYNDELSQRRAQSVMTELIRRGVGPANMATVALGKRQPVAPNDTDIGRAQNRRVEFMISAYQDANTRLIEKRRVNEDWLTTVRSEPAPNPVQPERLQVLKPEVRANVRIAANRPLLLVPSSSSVVLRTPEKIQPTKLGAQKVTMIKPESPDSIKPRSIDEEFAP